MSTGNHTPHLSMPAAPGHVTSAVPLTSPPAPAPVANAPPPRVLPIPNTTIPPVLPHERVFPIQIGSELFKLSGASLSSDAPSYFSQYFQRQLKKVAAENGGDAAAAAAAASSAPVRTLYIDRDPVTFRDISLHLQGYHVAPRDGTHFVRLFADAQFYSLPKLISQLYEESIFISIGHREFQIPRDLFQDPGNSPNYFSLGFAIFFSNPDDLFPGLPREGLLRPPSILPPCVPGRSAETFAEILHLLRGNPVEIRSEEHRQTLLRDCRYFNFKGLEQRLLPHTLTYNQARQRHEITLRLEDLFKSGISVATGTTANPACDPADSWVPPPPPSTAMSTSTTTSTSSMSSTSPIERDSLTGWVNYARPFVDDRPAELIVEIGGENTKLHFQADEGPGGPTTIRAAFFRDAKTRVARLFEVVATKLNLPPTTQPLGLLMAKGGASSQPPTPGNTPLSEDLVRVVLEAETAIELDGQPLEMGTGTMESNEPNGPSGDTPPLKRRRVDYAALAAAQAGPLAGSTEWVVRTGQWRLRIQRGRRHGKSAVECVLVGVRLEATSTELTRNRQRQFLG